MIRILFLSMLLLCEAASAFQSIAVLPFSNQTGKEQLYWLGEGFAESLSEEMLLHDALVIQRRRRLAGYDELHLPYTGDLSRATMLKIADKLAVDYIIFGSYRLQDADLQVEARVIKVSKPELSAPIQASGKLDRLYEVQAALRDGLVEHFGEESLQAESVKAFASQEVSLHAYELYIKGLLEDSDAERVKFFQRALQANPGYSQASFRLGAALYRLMRYRDSSEVLKKATFQGSFRVRAEFQVALNSYMSGDYEGAHLRLLELAKTNQTAEVYNNLGIALLKREDAQGAGWYLSRAVELRGNNPDYHFNLGCSYVMRSFDRQAVDQYREVFSRKPSDYQALYLTGKLLDRDPDPILKGPISRRTMQMFQEVLPADQKGKFPEQYTSVLQLLRPAALYLSPEEVEYENVASSRADAELSDIVNAYERRAADSVERNETAAAIMEIRKGTSLAPLNDRLYLLWGQSLLQMKDRTSAIPILEFSIWCKDNIESHLLLADLYRDAERYAESKLHVQRSLALDPDNKKALDIWGKIWDKQ